MCICTHKRPQLLGRLLSRLEEQETAGLFEFSIVVVDNDRSESARTMVETHARSSKIDTTYHVEPEQNIALARNKAVENAEADFIAFIDDDEFPNRRWLLTLYKTMKQYGSAGVLGPVLPSFDTEPPRWVLKGRFFDRPAHQTGHVLGWKNTRTGNALLRSELFAEDRTWFNPEFGSGGEDRDFFRKRTEEGHVFVWCNEAPVYETVPPERWKRTILLKRALLRGKMALNVPSSRPMSVLKSVVAVIMYTSCLPLFFLLGHHIFMKYLIRNCDHLGKVLSFCGIDLVQEKYVSG